ncbi:anti-sigma factor [Bacteroidia bacterium]|nr:anti-sigma factor [Bacteroidia bacterium]
MTTNKNKNFLLDNRFILWRLTGDKDMEAYWDAYLKNHPDSKDEFDNAICDFSRLKLNNSSLTDSEFLRLKERIYASTSGMHVKKRSLVLRLFPYAAAACITLIIGFSLYIYNNLVSDKNELITKNIIIGEDLDEKDILLITDNETTYFSKDVHMQVDKSGKATIQEAEGSESNVREVEKSIMNKMVVPYGKRSKLVLSDGTKVWLNSGSVLEFPSVFTEKTRSVNLIGEMYVEVSKDSKRQFVVHTLDFQVKVYGTKFNVTSYSGNEPQSVVLVEGSVSVKTAQKEEARLAPNDMLVYQNNHIDKKKVDVTEFISWKDGYILLDHTPVDVVLKRMERFYNLSFDIQSDVNLSSKTCTGKIFLSDNLDDVMATISLLSSTKYERKDKMIYIYFTL